MSNQQIKRQLSIRRIHIPQRFKKTPPRQEKLDKVKGHYLLYGELDKPITIDVDGNLIDGYTRYLIAKEFGLTYVDVIINDTSDDDVLSAYEPSFAERNKKRLDAGENEYIVGIFPNNENSKEYVWINRKGLDVNVGDMVKVKCCTKDGKKFTAPVKCVRKFWSANEPEHRSITSVIQKAS